MKIILQLSDGGRVFAAAVFFLIALGISPVHADSQLRVPGAGEISVSGNVILRDGAPWVAKGVILAGFVAPKGELRPAYAQGRSGFGDSMLDGVIRFGADTVRIHLSQAAADPKSKAYNAEYLQDYQSAVKLARERGLTVLVSMQWQGPTGQKGPGMPSDITSRAWQAVAAIWAHDRGVIYNLFNEPALRNPTPENWETWRKGHQTLIDIVRKAGANNVVIVDGLRAGHYLRGAPDLKDPLNQVIYAVHPFFNRESLTAEDWERDWGFASASRAVMATAWNARPSDPSCKRRTPKIARNFLAYLQQKKIGLIAWAYDLKGALVTNFEKATPVTFEGFACGVRGPFGPGELIKQHFHGQN